MKYIITIIIFAALVSCSKNSSTESNTDSNGTSDLPDVYKKIKNVSDIYVDGDFVVIKTTDVPNHKSPYFDQSDSRYEAYNGSNEKFSINPNRILEQSFTYKIPLHPAEASTKSSTQLGSIGVSVNGVAMFNQYAGPNQPLTNEINSFDQFNGHPQQSGVYHYHVEPLYITDSGKDALIGFLLDGFPVYGPEENGLVITNNDLDSYHGHKTATADFPDGIYHYHITAESPYINGGKYFGTAGTVTQ